MITYASLNKGVFSALVIGLLLATGCAGWRSTRDVEPLAPPPQYLNTIVSGVFPASDFPDGEWWPAIGDSTLNDLMDEAFLNNLTLEAAVARLDQFRALHSSAKSNVFPSINVQGSVSETGDVGDSQNPPGQQTTGTFYSIEASASYELDVWGRLNAGRAAALAELRSSEENLRGTVLVLSAQIARTYFRVVELQHQKELNNQTVASYRNFYNMVSNRYFRGLVPSLDVYQAETILAGAESQLAVTIANLMISEHALSVLLGRYPGTDFIGADKVMPKDVLDVPPGLPSELVKRRPDIQAAYWRMAALDKRAAEAVAGRLPSFSLTSAISGGSDELAGAVDPNNMIWSAIGGVLAPIFDGGRRKANADRAEAAWREQVASYKLAVLSAYQEVEDALARLTRQRDSVRMLGQQTRAAEASLNLATDRYFRGLSDYLPVITAQGANFNAQRNFISAQRILVETHIQLITALGGGWMDPVAGSAIERSKKNRKG